MQFFPDIAPDGHDADPEDVDQPRRPDWTGPPADWWPTAVGTSVLLASSDHVAVGVTGMSVYPTGVALSLRWMLRSRGQGRRDWADLMDRFEGGRFRGQADPARGIRFGLVLADGTPVLSHAEYELRTREPGHRLVRTPERDVHVHVYDRGATAVSDYLLLRDHLRSDAADRALYGDVKRELMTRRWEDTNDYAAAKDDVIAAIKARARAAEAARAAGAAQA